MCICSDRLAVQDCEMQVYRFNVLYVYCSADKSFGVDKNSIQQFVMSCENVFLLFYILFIIMLKQCFGAHIKLPKGPYTLGRISAHVIRQRFSTCFLCSHPSDFR